MSDKSVTKNELKSAIKDSGRKITDMQIDTPTEKQFDNLKQKVDQYHPVS